MSKNPAFLQENIDTRNMNNVVSAISAVVDAATEVRIDGLNTVRKCATSQVATHKVSIQELEESKISEVQQNKER